MSVHRVAAAYAKSVIELAKEKKALDKVYEDMVYITKVCDGSIELRKMLGSPIIGNYKKLSIIQEIFKGKVSDLTLSFFILTAKKKREDLLYFIAKEFIAEYKILQGIQTAVITTPIKISEPIKKQVNAILNKLADKKFELTNKIDPSIIGGFILNTGDKQIDASVSAKLNNIKNQFSTNPYISKY